MGKKYRAGVIGLGNIGFRFTLDPLRKTVASHVEAYLRHPDFELAAICDRDGGRLEEAARYARRAHRYASWKEMLAKERLDVVSVAVSPEFNSLFCASPYLKKLKAVILEKPLSVNPNAGSRIARRLNSRGVVSAVNYSRRWQETLRLAKRMIASGRIGKVTKASAFYPSTLELGGSHMIDALRHLFGEFDHVRALSKHPASGKRGYRYTAYGSIGRIEVYISGFDKRDFNIFDIEIWGAKGKLIITDFCSRIEVFKARPSRRFSGQNELVKAGGMKMRGAMDYFPALLDDISMSLKKPSRRTACPAEDALNNDIVMDAIKRGGC